MFKRKKKKIFKKQRNYLICYHYWFIGMTTSFNRIYNFMPTFTFHSKVRCGLERELAFQLEEKKDEIKKETLKEEIMGKGEGEGYQYYWGEELTSTILEETIDVIKEVLLEKDESKKEITKVVFTSITPLNEWRKIKSTEKIWSY